MTHLTLVGLSDDGKRLLLVSDKGVEFTLDVDSRLRAALRGEHARLGQLEITMDSTLRPRDIQARIRSGETPEAVAQAAHTTVDRILPYANPVLAERAHVAQRAQRSSVRRKSGDTGARTLGEAVAAQLRALNVDPATVEWDAWRREDGRWALTGAFDAGRRKGTAGFVFDAPGNYVLVENDDARWLVGEIVAKETTAAPQRDEIGRARQRRLSAVPAEELPLGDDALELANEAAEAEADDDVVLAPTPEPLAEPATERERATGAAAESDAGTEDEPDDEPGAEEEPADEVAQAAPEQPRRPAKRRGRASVPSWDEIMFGGGKSE